MLLLEHSHPLTRTSPLISKPSTRKSPREKVKRKLFVAGEVKSKYKKVVESNSSVLKKLRPKQHSGVSNKEFIDNKATNEVEDNMITQTSNIKADDTPSNEFSMVEFEENEQRRDIGNESAKTNSMHY